MPFLVERLVDRQDHVLIGARLVRDVREFFSQRLAGNGDAIAMQQAGVEQQLHHLRDAAGFVQVGGHILARRFEVADDGHALAHPLEVIDGPFHFRSVGDGQVVQHGVGGAAGGHDHGHGVLDGLARDDVARLQVAAHGINQHARGFGGAVDLLLIGIGHRR